MPAEFKIYIRYGASELTVLNAFLSDAGLSYHEQGNDGWFGRKYFTATKKDGNEISPDVLSRHPQIEKVVPLSE